MTDTVGIDVVICTYQRANDLDATLAALADQVYAHNLLVSRQDPSFRDYLLSHPPAVAAVLTALTDVTMPAASSGTGKPPTMRAPGRTRCGWCGGFATGTPCNQRSRRATRTSSGSATTMVTCTAP